MCVQLQPGGFPCWPIQVLPRPGYLQARLRQAGWNEHQTNGLHCSGACKRDQQRAAARLVTLVCCAAVQSSQSDTPAAGVWADKLLAMTGFRNQGSGVRRACSSGCATGQVQMGIVYMLL